MKPASFEGDPMVPGFALRADDFRCGAREVLGAGEEWVCLTLVLQEFLCGFYAGSLSGPCMTTSQDIIWLM